MRKPLFKLNLERIVPGATLIELHGDAREFRIWLEQSRCADERIGAEISFYARYAKEGIWNQSAQTVDRCLIPLGRRAQKAIGHRIDVLRQRHFERPVAHVPHFQLVRICKYVLDSELPTL